MNYPKFTAENIEDATKINLADIPNIGDGSITIGNWSMIRRRTAGFLAGKSIYLDDENYDWIIGKDNEAAIVLVPIPKTHD